MAGTASAVGRRLQQARTRRGLSLSELARRAGIGKGSLSEIEAGGRNPTLETLYALSLPLQLPITALVGETGRSNVSGHDEGPVIIADSGMIAITLDVRHQPDGSVVEVFRLEFPDGCEHESPAHGPGVRETLTVSRGTLRVGPIGRLRSVTAGRTRSWLSDRAHRYRAPDGPAEAVVVIISQPT
ncbi:helix-turn-helix transcriptional regulator [Microlunatus elymi]|uniref:Helix-turn-helix transcriptional regulator n=2 Tax=Microlunatus elymi TaxID=2596828 RepID=A0A516Q5T9_9ACTN|nr:helix-turn-helix transcriptional regulator [Microlunatus elymi]